MSFFFATMLTDVASYGEHLSFPNKASAIYLTLVDLLSRDNLKRLMLCTYFLYYLTL